MTCHGQPKLWWARALAFALASSLALAGCGDDGGDDDDDMAADAAAGGGDATPAADAAGGGGADASTSAAAVVVDAAWVLAALDDATVQLIDVRSRSAYDTSRIEGAAHVDASALRATVGGVSGQVAPPDVGAGVLAAAGVRRDATAVVYGDATDTTAARVAWTLEYYGHADVRLLDGGWGAWQAAGYAVDTGAPPTGTTPYTVTAVADGLRVDKAWMLAHLDDPQVVLVDARSTGEYSAGRIPGALSVDWTRNVSGGALRPRAEVAALYDTIASDATVVTYCQSGSRASVSYVVLRWLGFVDVRLYDGSWAEWGADGSTPKETD